jgi:hypothetical protein
MKSNEIEVAGGWNDVNDGPPAGAHNSNQKASCRKTEPSQLVSPEPKTFNIHNSIKGPFLHKMRCSSPALCEAMKIEVKLNRM